MKNTFTVLIVIINFLIPVSAHAAVQYTITDLGVLSGMSNSYASGINNNGQVAGFSTTSWGTSEGRAYIYSNGTLTDLGTLGGAHSAAYGINDNGQVVGWADTTSNGPEHAFLYSNTKMIDLGTLGGNSSNANGISSNGLVTGWAQTTDGNQHAFVYGSGTMTDLGTFPGSTSSNAYGVNDSGQVAGVSGYYGFIYSSGVMTRIGRLSGQGTGSSSVARAINDNGEVVGNAGTATNVWHAFLYTNGTMSDLGTLTSAPQSIANCINSKSQIVGYTLTSNGTPYHAFVYDNGNMQDLNDMISSNSGWTLSNALGINDLGQIVGNGTINGQTRGYLLTPVPEPSTLVLLGMGVIGLIAWAWRRNRKAV